MPIIPKESLFREIRRVSAAWVPEASWFSILNDTQRRALLGLRIQSNELTTLRMIQAARRSVGARTEAVPSRVDWRACDCVSPVKNQGCLPASVTFATMAVIESMAAIEKGELLELSAADLAFGPVHDKLHESTWPSTALEEVKRRGVVEEAAFPACAMFGATGAFTCGVLAEREHRVVRVRESSLLFGMAERKRWLAEVGPVLAGFKVYDDFFSYRSGVYTHVMGAMAGYHLVAVVGYDDDEGCWICKNSWGEAWGEQGFFSIAYGQCGIDETSAETDDADEPLHLPFWGVRGVTLPTRPAPRVEAVHAARRPDGRVDVFAVSAGGSVAHAQPPREKGEPWRHADLGGKFVEVIAANDAEGRRELFAVDTDRRVWVNAQSRSRAGEWRGWRRIGGNALQIAAAQNDDGRLEVFAVGDDGKLRHARKLPLLDNSWGAWQELGSGFRDIVVLPDRHGQLTLLAVGLDGALWIRAQTGTEPDRWSPWSSVHGGVKRIAAVPDADGDLVVFAIHNDDRLYQLTRTRPDGAWGPWRVVGGICHEVRAVRASDGLISVVARTDEGVALMRQASTRTDAWDPWRLLTGLVRRMDAASERGGEITVVTVDLDGHLRSIVDEPSPTAS